MNIYLILNIELNLFLIEIIKKKEIVERIMGTCAICLSSGSHASTLTAVDLGIVRWIAGALPSKAGEDSASPLR